MKNTEEKELFNWEVREEKIKWNKQRELTFIIIGITAAVVAIIFTYYLTTVVIGLALVYINNTWQTTLSDNFFFYN